MSGLQATLPPPWAQRMGYAGLVPFVALALGTWVLGPAHNGFSGFALLAYGATIASFLGAIHWGLAMRDASQQSLALLGWSVTPSLLAWVALLAGPFAGLVVIACLLWACMAVDRMVYPRYQLQGWLRMRLTLTLIASASSVLGALGMLQ